jgi:hypothetical protein
VDLVETNRLELPVSAEAIAAWVSWFWIGIEAGMTLGIGERQGHQREALAAVARLLQLAEDRRKPPGTHGRDPK